MTRFRREDNCYLLTLCCIPPAPHPPRRQMASLQQLHGEALLESSQLQSELLQLRNEVHSIHAGKEEALKALEVVQVRGCGALVLWESH